MRMRATKERRRDRQEFIYKYRHEIAELIKSGKMGIGNDVHKFVESTARPELTYGPKTYYFDIYMALLRDYSKLFNIKLW